jgi:hypothetical protein
MTNFTSECHTSKYPLHVKEALKEIDAHAKRLADDLELKPKRGPVKLHHGREPGAALIADTEEELIEKTEAFIAAVGKKMPGNKRAGRMRMYAALVSDFYLLKKMGIILPRNKNLSLQSMQYGLARTLIEFNLTDQPEEVLLSQKAKGVAARRKIAFSRDRVFARVADAVEHKLDPNYPPQK